MDSVTHTYWSSTTTSTSIASTKETSFKNLHSTSGSTVTFEALWIDDIKPTDVTITTTNNTNATSQTATLSCTDWVWVTSYYWWTSTPTASSTYTNVTSTSSFSTWKSVTNSGTYYFACKDSAGNVSDVKSITYVKYQVKNMLDKITWITNTYNTTNYAVDTTKPTASTYYIISWWTSLTLVNLCTAPNTPSTRKITSVWNPSTTVATNTATASAANQIYACWYARNTYDLTLNKWTWVASVLWEWTYKHGATANISATVDSIYSWKNWTVIDWDTPVDVTKSGTTVVITKNTTLQANANAIPQISFADPTPAHNAAVTQNRFTTKMNITNIDSIKNFEYQYKSSEYDLMSWLLLMYNFDNVTALWESTTVVKDLSNNWNDWVVHWAIRVNNWVHWWAYSFDGSTWNYIDFPSYGALNTNWTISLWVKWTLPTSSTIVMWNYNWLAVWFWTNWSLIWSTSWLWNKARWVMQWYNISWWNHIVVTLNGWTISYYVNGIKLVNGSETSWTWTNNSIWRIWRRNNNSNPYPFKWMVDEVRVYNRALSQDEVQFLYKSNLKKTSADTWEFETINTCLDAIWTYNYTWSVVSYVDTQASTGRKLTSHISDVSVDSTWYDFGTHTASWSQQVLRWTMWTLTVTDYLWKSWWKVYFTTSPTLVWKNTNQTIDTTNLKFKATNLTYNWLYDGTLNTHVTLWTGMSTSQYKTAHWSAPTDNILEYIVRTGDVNDFMCGDVWTYSDNTQIELTVPAWQIQDTYTWTLWVTRQQD